MDFLKSIWKNEKLKASIIALLSGLAVHTAHYFGILGPAVNP
jgi:hypothetical protein